MGHINGSDPKPKDEKKDDKSDGKKDDKWPKWEIKDAQIIFWIQGSIDPQLILNLRPYKTAIEMCLCLKQIYTQENAARSFHLEDEISQYSSRTIQDYYYGFIGLWTEYTEIIYTGLSDDSLTSIQHIYKISCRDQFLMKLWPQF